MKRIWPTIFPVLLSDRFKLRALETIDLPELVICCNHYDISRQTSSLPYPYTLDFAVGRLKLIQEGFKDFSRLVWLIVEKDSGKIVGEIGLHWRDQTESMEVGYWIAKDYWGLGIATESLIVVLDFAKQLRIAKSIFGTHFVDNPASGRIMKKAGMLFEGEVDPVLNQEGVLKKLNCYRYDII
jgi:RimJ/RimL family protein N-acetyltransferase